MDMEDAEDSQAVNNLINHILNVHLFLYIFLLCLLASSCSESNENMGNIQHRGKKINQRRTSRIKYKR